MGKSTKTFLYLPSIELGATHDSIFIFSKVNVVQTTKCDFCSLKSFTILMKQTGHDKHMRTKLFAYWPDLTFLCTANFCSVEEMRGCSELIPFQKLLLTCSHLLLHKLPQAMTSPSAFGGEPLNWLHQKNLTFV